MSESHFLVRKVAVLGAGVMGAQIAAHLANASVPVVLFDLAAKEGDPNGIAQKAIENLKKLEPSPLATKERADYIDAANYDQHLALLAGCDLVIEAISERMDWKKALYERVAPHIGAQAIFASNTSGTVDQRARRCLSGLVAAALLRHPLFQPAALHAPGRADRAEGHRARAARSTRNVSGHHARQGRGARQGHAQLRRQSRWCVLDAGDDGAYRALRPGLRRGRRADRPG